jgi:predicted flavoprotein YhiN
MASKLVPSLYFAGELLDVDGDRGGFNFHFAWVSGMRAGKAVRMKLLDPEDTRYLHNSKLS